MSCVLPNRETLNTLLEKGLDPLEALTQMEIMYSEISGLESSFDFKRNNISDATMKDVNAFMKSEEYTEELKQALSFNSKISSEKESVLDYLQYGRIRKASEFLEESVPNLEDLISDISTVKELVAKSNQENALAFAKEVSSRLNVPFKVISESEFADMFPGRSASKNPAFFKNGEVYFVEGFINSNTVFHEFSHPFIKALRIDNPELFSKLWSDFLSDSRSKGIIENLALENELELGSYEYMQEAMARILELEYQEPKATNFITQLLFNIKQFLRKMFGKKINISKLSVNTKLSDIVSMISEGNEVLFNQNFVTEDDIVEFQTDYDNFIEPLKKMRAEKTQEFMNTYYLFLENQIKNMKANPETFGFVSEDLVNENSSGLLEQMRKTLSNLAYFVSSKSNKPLDTLDPLIDSEYFDFESRIKAFGMMLADVDIINTVFSRKIKSLENSADKRSDDFFDSVLTMSRILESWVNHYENLISKTPRTVPGPKSNAERNPLLDRLLEQQTELRDLLESTKKIQTAAVTDLLYEHYLEYNKPIIEDLKSRLDYFENAGIDKAYESVHIELYGMTPDQRLELRYLNSLPSTPSGITLEQLSRRDFLMTLQERGYNMSKESFKRIMSGQSVDAYGLSAMFENYANNQDSVVSTFYMSLKNTFNELAGNVNAKRNEMLTGLSPLLKAAGYDTKVFGEASLGKAIVQKTTSFKYDANNDVVEHEEYQFLNNFINWEYDRKILEQKVGKLKEQWLYSNTEEDEDKYLNAKEELENFDENYMTREYVDEYYEVQKLFRGTIGRKALKAYENILKTINLTNSQLYADPNDVSLKKKLLEDKNAYRQLYNLYDKNGVLKTGASLEIAKILSEYLQRTREMYESKEIPNQFEIAYDHFINKLILEFGGNTLDPLYQKRVYDWLKLNTHVKISDEHYDKRKQLVERRKELLSFMDEQNKSLVDLTPLYDELNELLKVNRDEYNIIDGTQMSFEKQKRIVEIQEQINQVTENYYQPKTGFTKQDNKRYRVLRYNLGKGIKLSPSDIDFMDDYESNISASMGVLNTALTTADIAELIDIENELRSLSRPVTTQAYIDEFISKFEASPKYSVWKTFALNKGYDVEFDVIPSELIDEFLAHPWCEDIVSKNPTDSFVVWFKANHYVEDDVAQYSADGTIEDIGPVFRKSQAWKTSMPVSNSAYSVKSIGMIPYLPPVFREGDRLVLDGIPVVPNQQYMNRDVKDDFKTKLEERDFIDASGNLVLANVDNRGNMLPRDFVSGDPKSAVSSKYINANYKAMLQNNEPLFKLLNFLKYTQLDHEKGLNKNSKIFLTIPSMRKGKLESYDSNYFNRKVLRTKEFFTGAADDSELDSYDGSRRNTGISEINEFTTFTRPISGNYKIDSIDVSLNIVESLMMRMSSIEEYKLAQRKSSYSTSVTNTVKSFMISPEQTTFLEQARNYRKFTEVEVSKNKRLKMLEYIVKNKINGINLHEHEWLTTNKTRQIVSTIGTLQGSLANMAFAFDIIKGSRNYIGGKSMMWKKALDEGGYGFSDLLATRHLSGEAIALFIGQRYKNNTIPAKLQLLSLLEAIPDSIIKDSSTYGSQTMAQDLVEGNWKFTIRKYLNDSVPLHQMFALMHANKVMYNGVETPLYELIELDNKGRLITKTGTPEEWSISYSEDGTLKLGDRIKDIMNEHKSLLNKNLGLAGKKDEPEAMRTIVGKIVFTMMKFFPGMLMDRYALNFDIKTRRLKMRRNLNQKRIEVGTFTSILLLAQEAIERKGKFYMLRSYSPQAVAGFYQLLAAVLIQYLLYSLIRSIGFDEDDDDIEDFKFDPHEKGIYSRLRHTTSLPQLPFVSDNRTVVLTGNNFDTENYLKLQLLNLLTQVQGEEETFNPKQAAVNIKNTVFLKNALAESGALDLANDALNLMTAPDRKKVYDQAAGPYVWQQEDENKMKNLVSKSLGLNGSMLDPAYALENRYNMSNK